MTANLPLHSSCVPGVYINVVNTSKLSKIFGYTNYRNYDTQRMSNFALFRRSCASIAISRVPRKIDNTFLFDNADLIPPNPAQWYQLDYLPRCQCTPNVSCFTFNLPYISLSVKATHAQYLNPDKSDKSIHFSQH